MRVHGEKGPEDAAARGCGLSWSLISPSQDYSRRPSPSATGGGKEHEEEHEEHEEHPVMRRNSSLVGWEVFGGWASVFRYFSFKSRCCDAPAHTIKLCFWLVYPIFHSIGVQQSALANHRD